MSQTSEKNSNSDDLDTALEVLIASLPVRGPIYLPTEKISTQDQIEGLIKVKNIYTDTLLKIHQPRLKALREKYKTHNRVFIIGNGPSLNITDLSRLKDEVTICVNSFFLKMPELSWVPNLYVVEDHLVAEDRADEINKLDGLTKIFPAYLGYCLEEDDNTIYFNHRPRVSYPSGFDFSTDAANITYTGCTVTFTCMQLAYYLGFKEIYLIGVDASYDIPKDINVNSDYGTGVLDMRSDDPNHFHSDYFGKGYRWHDPQVDKMLEAYAEAKTVTEHLGTKIFNATIGGKLEVFERVDYQALFPDALSDKILRKLNTNTPLEDVPAQRKVLEQQRDKRAPDTAHSSFPKLLLIDMTRTGDMTATGELKKTLFGDWPAARLLQVFSNGRCTAGVVGGMISAADGRSALRNKEDVLNIIHHFKPDAILYRPVSDKPFIHKIAKDAIAQTGAPLATWIMDAWQDRLMRDDPSAGAKMETELKALFARSAFGLSICDTMSKAYGPRYKTDFKKFSNAINPKDWAGLMLDRKLDKGTLLVRYSGGLSPDMTLDSLISVADAIEALASAHKIKFEISTGKHWMDNFSHHFDSYKNTSLSLGNKSTGEYRAWLSSADISLIAYNFLSETVSYVRYSMANKLPECLASGSMLLAIGPEELATIEYLKTHDLGMVITKPGSDVILSTLLNIIKNKEMRVSIEKKGQVHAFKYFNLAKEQKAFQSMIKNLAQSPKIKAAPRTAQSVEKNLKNSKKGITSSALVKFIQRVSRFYFSRKGIMAMIVIGLFALPAIKAESVIDAAIKLGPTFGAAFFLVIIGNWISQILDQ